MSVTEVSHTQIPSRGMRAWKKNTSLWQWRTARCGGRLWIRSRLPGPPFDDDSALVGGVCGPDIENLVDVELVAIFQCEKSAFSHLRSFKIGNDAAVNSESKLLLARGGKAHFVFCPRPTYALDVHSLSLFKFYGCKRS